MKRTNFSFKRNKKGSLNLSINAIVILILAVTMLGLGLMFIRGTFERGSDSVFGAFNELEQKRADEARDGCSEEVCIDFISGKLTDNSKLKKSELYKYQITLNNRLSCDLKDVSIKYGVAADPRGCQTFGGGRDSSLCDHFTVGSFDTDDVGAKVRKGLPLEITVKNTVDLTTYKLPILVEGECEGFKFGGSQDLQLSVGG